MVVVVRLGMLLEKMFDGLCLNREGVTQKNYGHMATSMGTLRFETMEVGVPCLKTNPNAL